MTGSNAGLSPLRVLVVEDNSINRLVVREMLERGGHKVDEAHDGQEGVAMASRWNYDLVFMDISMPVLDGLEATRMIRAAEAPGRHLPIVALTAHALPAEIERFRQAGLDDVLVKPISRDTLGAVLTRAVGRATGGGQPTGSAVAPGEEPIIEAAQIAEMRELLGDARTARQIETFLEQIEDLVTETSQAISAGSDAEVIRASIHRVAGSAGLLGAVVLREHLRLLETEIASQGDAACIDIPDLQEIVSDTAGAMRGVLASMSATVRP
jgi:CheY-like chemotaxis protein/HPt (histidine-containing phosphotransfer) domain-containing protein